MSFTTASSPLNRKPRKYICPVPGVHMRKPYLSVANWADIFFPKDGTTGEKRKTRKTAFYAEYESRGEGANPKARAAFSRQLKNLKGYEMKTVLAGDDGWNPVEEGNKLLDVRR